MYPWLNASYLHLAQRAVNSQLHHGLLLHGPVGLGKTELANQLTAVLLCQAADNLRACGRCQSCQLRIAGSHPDFHQVVKEKSQIGVDQIRDGIAKLNQTAQLSGNKVLVIHQAESLNQASANALLKTLEEPTANTYLILITSQLDRLLPTILSRCEKVNLPLPEEELALTWLKQQGVETDKATLRLCNSAPLAAKALCEDTQRLQYPEFEKSLANKQQGAVSAGQLAVQWQDQADWVATLAQHVLHERYLHQPNTKVWECYQFCLQARKQLQQVGINKSLVLTKILNMI